MECEAKSGPRFRGCVERSFFGMVRGEGEGKDEGGLYLQ